MSSKTYVPTDRPAAFVIVEPNPVIAADIAQSIGEVPGAGPAVAVRDAAGAEAQLRLPGSCRAVFLRAETQTEFAEAAALEPLARRRGADIVAMSGALAPAEAAARNWQLLPLPFTPGMIHALLARLSGG